MMPAGKTHRHAEAEADADWSATQERSNATLLRWMTWLSLRLGRRASRLLLRFIGAYFIVSSPAARRASRTYLQRALGRPARRRDVARHLFTFATTIHDRIYLLNGRFDLFDIRIHGAQYIEQALADGRGAFLMGAHLGSFEVVRAIGREHPALRVAVTMYRDSAQRLNDVLATINPAVRQDIIPLGQLDAMLQVREYLERGYMIGMLADRTLAGRATDPEQRCDFLGAPADFPTGPLRMAAMLRQPVIFMTGLYRGGNRYDIHFTPVADFTAVPRGEREQAVQAALARYVTLLQSHCRDAPYNWFNFYDFWHAASPATARASER